MSEGMYKQDVFVRPKFFDHDKLQTYLRTNPKTVPLAEKIKSLREEITDKTYEVLASQILEEVVFEKLTL